MAEPHYLLSLKFIRETEQDLEKALRADVSAFEQYERLIAALAELERSAPTFPANSPTAHGKLEIDLHAPKRQLSCRTPEVYHAPPINSTMEF